MADWQRLLREARKSRKNALKFRATRKLRRRSRLTSAALLSEVMQTGRSGMIHPYDFLTSMRTDYSLYFTLGESGIYSFANLGQCPVAY